MLLILNKNKYLIRLFFKKIYYFMIYLYIYIYIFITTKKTFLTLFFIFQFLYYKNFLCN